MPTTIGNAGYIIQEKQNT